MKITESEKNYIHMGYQEFTVEFDNQAFTVISVNL